MTATGSAGQAAQQDYLGYVVCESADKIALIRFGPRGAQVEKLIDTGAMPSDIDGPHGLVVSPDKQFNTCLSVMGVRTGPYRSTRQRMTA